MLNFKKPIPQKVPKENCKIKIKQGRDGSKTISFQGTCSKEQLEMAKVMNGADKIIEGD